jgi:hypothetical protein
MAICYRTAYSHHPNDIDYVVDGFATLPADVTGRDLVEVADKLMSLH